MGKLSYTTTQIDLGLRKSLTPYSISLQLGLPATTTCTLADTWYDVDGDFSDGSSNGFTYVATGGIFTYTGSEDCFFIFIGDADLDIGSSASTITYGLFADTGSGYTEQTRFTSITEFTANETSKSLGTNGETPTAVSTGADFKVMVKSSSAGVTINHRNLKVTMIEAGCGGA